MIPAPGTSRYSFCKANSAIYAMMCFPCAYLMAHHPAHVLAWVVANEGGFYQPAAYLEEARQQGVRIHGPCVVESRGGSSMTADGL